LNTARILQMTLPNVATIPLTFDAKNAADYDDILRNSSWQGFATGSHKRGIASTPGAFSIATNPKWFDPSQWATYLGSNPDPFTVKASSDLAHSKGLGYFIKSIESENDVLRAFQNGADGVIISNHGGRYTAGSKSTVDFLWSIRNLIKDIRDGVYDGTGPFPAAAQNGQYFIVGIDSGIRSGEDVAKCIAMGASFCSVGRPATWGLAVNGIPGAYGVFEYMIRELNFVPRRYGYSTIDSFRGSALAASPTLEVVEDNHLM
jgi:isopentenyl diphosphate isomerase/L-lactate dehydrogenase-like FMN-dependent dehydrogenase